MPVLIDEERSGTLLTVVAGTTDQTSEVKTKPAWANSLILSLVVTANPGGAETLTMNFVPRDFAGGGEAVNALMVSAAAVNGAYHLAIGEGLTGTPENPTRWKQYAIALSHQWHVLVDHSAAGAWSYTLRFSYGRG